MFSFADDDVQRNHREGPICASCGAVVGPIFESRLVPQTSTPALSLKRTVSVTLCLQQRHKFPHEKSRVQAPSNLAYIASVLSLPQDNLLELLQFELTASYWDDD